MEIEKGTFGSQEDFKVLYVLNIEAETDKRIRKILSSYNNDIKALFECDLQNKERYYRYILNDFKLRVEKLKFEPHIHSRLNNYFISKIKKHKEDGKHNNKR